MKGKLREYALIAEVVGSVAVLITLIVLIYQVRESNELEKATSYQEITYSLNEWRQSIYTNSEIASIYSSYITNSLDLRELEGRQITMLMLAVLDLWSIYDSAYSSNVSGLLSEDDWGRVSDGMCLNYPLLIRRPVIKENIWNYLSYDFKEHLQNNCN